MEIIQPTSQIRILAASAVAVSRASANAAADTTEQALVTIPIPAGAMGPNGILRLTTLWTVTNSATQKIARARLNGVAGTAFLSFSLTTVVNAQYITLIRNRNAQNSQVGSYNSNQGVGSAAAAAVTSSIDTAAAVDLALTGVWGTQISSETITLESYLLELIRP